MEFYKILPVPSIVPIVTLTLFRYDAKNRLWSFNSIRKAKKQLKGVDGLMFFKPMGKGVNFSLMPDFSCYALFCTWENDAAASKFFTNNLYFKTLHEKSKECWTIKMIHQSSSGSWDGINPFLSDYIACENELPVAVFTRSTLKLPFIFNFWRKIPPLSKALENSKGLLFSVGLGESFLLRQGNFAIWRDVNLLKKVWSKKEKRRKDRNITRRNWFREELTAFFIPIGTHGSFNGKDVIRAFMNKKFISMEMPVN
jgi:hypothetical protein